MSELSNLTDSLIVSLRQIPEGASRAEIALEKTMLDPQGPLLLGGAVSVARFRAEDLVTVDFTVRANVELVCERSLETFIHPIEGSYSVEFSPRQEEREEGARAYRGISPEGPTLDLNKDVRDTILLGLPLQPLHPRFFDSKGVPIEFETRTFGLEDGEPATDPRWDKLKQLRDMV